MWDGASLLILWFIYDTKSIGSLFSSHMNKIVHLPRHEFHPFKACHKMNELLLYSSWCQASVLHMRCNIDFSLFKGFRLAFRIFDTRVESLCILCMWVLKNFVNIWAVTVYLQADVDHNGTIDYGEFIAATVHLNKLEREEHLMAAFRYFDKDGSGSITVDELQQAWAEHNMTDIFLEDIIREVDLDNVSPRTWLWSRTFRDKN